MGLCSSRSGVVDVKRKFSIIESKSTGQILCDSLSLAIVGNGEPPIENGEQMYQYLFSIHPRLQAHFIGADEFMGQESKQSTKFAKQGQRLLMAIQMFCQDFDNKDAFDQHVKDLMIRHRERKVEPEMWGEFFTIFANFLKTKGEVSSIEEDAWRQLGERFNSVAQDALKSLDLPYVAKEYRSN